METIIWKVDKSVDNLSTYPQIQKAAAILQKNELVAFPTETVYGLGANARSDEAVEKIYQAKGRPSDNPLIIHISSIQDVEKYVEKVPKVAQKLMEQFWPGPLTIILEKKAGALSERATAGLSTVGIRMPDHPVALALIEASGLPIAAPSANRSGKPSPTKFEHVYEDLNGKIAGIVDGGPTGVGVESTVIDCTEDVPLILRPGGVTKEELEAVIGPVRIDPNIRNVREAPKSPGMKYQHYAPNADMYLVDGSPSFLQQTVDAYRKQGKRVGVLTTEEHSGHYEADFVISAGSREDLATIAQNIFHCLRLFDEQNVDIVLSETFPDEGIGAAIMNRLVKAAGHKWLREG